MILDDLNDLALRDKTLSAGINEVLQLASQRAASGDIAVDVCGRSCLVPSAGAILLLLGSLLCAIPAAAQDDDQQLSNRSISTRPAEQAAFGSDEGEGLFGFSEQSSTGEEGEREVSAEAFYRLRTRVNKHHAIENRVTLEFSPRDNVGLGFSAFYDRYGLGRNRFRGEDEESDGSVLARTSTVTGLSGELKYSILERGSNPIGVAISLEPEVRRVINGAGFNTQLAELETKLMLDFEIIPGRVLGALNASWQPQVTFEGSRVLGRDTNLEFSGSVVTQIASGIFLGGEARYVSAFEGLSFRRAPDYGIFIGPTAYARLSEKLYVSAAWGIRIGGVIRGEPESLPDFGDVPDPAEKHLVRIKIGASF